MHSFNHQVRDIFPSQEHYKNENLTCRQNSLELNFFQQTGHPQQQFVEDPKTCARPFARMHLVICLRSGSTVAFHNSLPFFLRYIKDLHFEITSTCSSSNSSSINYFFNMVGGYVTFRLSKETKHKKTAYFKIMNISFTPMNV